MTKLNRTITGICGLALLVVLVVPLWQIQLSAPQYPEGLVLKMYPHKLAGNVDIINGLNHYIGMKTLHTEDFIEFTVLPYLIVFFALFCLAVALFLKTFRWLLGLFILFVLFGVVAMADFWRWEYQYGHDLDPNAAINVPGMTYQPPMLGYKQLLNFGAYSIPDTGGWIFVAVGMLLLAAVISQYLAGRKYQGPVKGTATMTVLSGFMLLLSSCSTDPQPITAGKDACSFCKMGVADPRFGAELITRKGKIYKFDDLHCYMKFRESGTVRKEEVQATYVVDYEAPHDLIDLDKAFLLQSGALKSPMGSNVAGFKSEQELKPVAALVKGEMIRLENLTSGQ